MTKVNLFLVRLNLELLDPNITPEKVLKLLSSKHESTNGELISIFLVSIKFIAKKLPGGFVEGIWENIMWKVLSYSKHIWPKDVYAGFGTDIRIDDWLQKALDTHRTCPNPYIRLGLFRLMWLSSAHLYYNNSTRDRLCVTFIHTICDIKPHRLYPSGDNTGMDDVMFSAQIMETIFSKCCSKSKLQQIISADLIKQLKETNEVIDNSFETGFICKCIQIIGVLAVMAQGIPDPEIKYYELRKCCLVFQECIGRLVNCDDQLPGISPWMQFLHIFSRPPFHRYVVETVCELTAAVINYNRGVKQYELMYLRDSITEDLDVCHDTFELPWILLSRQVQGSKLARQNSLLLRKIMHKFLILDSDKDSGGLALVSSIGISSEMPLSEDSSDSRDSISYFSDSTSHDSSSDASHDSN